MLHFVFLGHFEPGIEHVHDGVLVLRVERVGSADHHDQVDIELEGAKPFEHIVQILGIGSREQGDLDIVEFDGGSAAKQAHAGYDLEDSRAGARKLA